MKIRPVILCGGAGTRLWPQSEENLPKQFIDWGGWTLFGKTLERVKSSIFDYPVITTNSAYINLVKKYPYSGEGEMGLMPKIKILLPSKYFL